MNTLTKSNIEETIYDWFDTQNIEVKKLYIERDKLSEEPRLYIAKGEFKPCLFDKEMDGKKLEVRFQLEVSMQDERFGGCDLIFTSDTTFKII